MQTFLPFADFTDCAKALDRQRLGKQRVEAAQIYHALTGDRSYFVTTRGPPPALSRKNHPAVRMWAGYEGALLMYLRAMILEWISRGYMNNMPIPTIRRYQRPHWLGDPQLHSAHRATLKRKNPDYYTFDDDTPFFYPEPKS